MEYTYCRGVIFYSYNKHDITKHDIYKICLSLNDKFGEGYEFFPEPICEGGILMKKFPDKKDNQLKTMRICGRDEEDNYGKWPIIHENLNINEWKDNNEKIYFYVPRFYTNKNKKKFLIHTVLKAFHGAPVWTKNELLMICEVFNDIGFQIIKKTFPTKKKLLKTGGSLGMLRRDDPFPCYE